MYLALHPCLLNITNYFKLIHRRCKQDHGQVDLTINNTFFTYSVFYEEVKIEITELVPRKKCLDSARFYHN